MKKILTHWTLAFITLAVLTFVGLQDPQIKEVARLKSFDLQFQSQPKEVSQDIVIITIDEKSIELYGHWPWKRDVLAGVIEELRAAEVGVIVLPILFSEEDRLGGDDALAKALKDNFVVVAQTGSHQTTKNGYPRGVAKIGNPLEWLFEWPGMVGPIPEIGDNAAGVGVTNVAPEIDGVVRRMPLLMKIGNDVYPSIAIEVIRTATGDPSYQVKAGDAGIIAMRVPGFATINTDPHARIWLTWNKEYKTISLAEAGPGTFDDLKGKTIIIATTAEGLGGVIATPTGSNYDYVAVASTLQTVIDGVNIERPDISFLIELAVAFLVGFVIIILARFTPYYVVGVMMVAFSAAAVYSTIYFFGKNQLVDVTWILVTIILVGLHSIFNRFILEFFEKQKIKKQFAGYASPTVVKMLQENPSLIKDGMKKEVSICFSDLRGFTPLGESFGDDVKGLTKLMNQYMDAITEPVLDAKGMIIKYIGDASMHIHNAPIDDPNHQKSAVQTGLNMLKAVEKFNVTLQRHDKPTVGMGAGINTGLGYLGEMGSTRRHSYDVLGDAVSTAARIESKCKEYGCVLLVGENTYEATKNDFFYLKIDDLAVKGKTVGITIYTVLSDAKHMMNNTNWGVAENQHIKMHKYYQNQQFDNAIRLCKSLMTEFDGKMKGYYEMWIERCEYMKTQQLPEDWNGVFIATTK